MNREISWVREPYEASKSHRCPCCKYKTLFGRGQDEICRVCYWQDDGQDEPDADIVLGGPNGTLSLTEARSNFLRFAAVEERFKDSVRPPLADEI
jgi:Cysteine-rich CPCC